MQREKALSYMPRKGLWLLNIATPKYASYRSQSFRDFGVIHWEPNINIEKGISDEFKMLDTGLDEINFYIEGVSSDGTVFSQLVKLETSDKE